MDGPTESATTSAPIWIADDFHVTRLGMQFFFFFFFPAIMFPYDLFVLIFFPFNFDHTELPMSILPLPATNSHTILTHMLCCSLTYIKSFTISSHSHTYLKDAFFSLIYYFKLSLKTAHLLTYLPKTFYWHLLTYPLCDNQCQPMRILQEHQVGVIFLTHPPPSPPNKTHVMSMSTNEVIARSSCKCYILNILLLPTYLPMHNYVMSISTNENIIKHEIGVTFLTRLPTYPLNT